MRSHCSKAGRLEDSLALAAEFERVPAQPVGAAGAALRLVELVALAEAAGLLAGGGETAQLAVLHHRSAHPVDLRVATDGGVRHVHHDHLEVLVGGILANPVRAEHPQPLESAAHSLLGDALQVSLGLLLFHRAGGLRLAVWAALQYNI